MKTLNLAIVGLGNCASSLLQGLTYYTSNKDLKSAGLMHPVIDGYDIASVTPVAVFDCNLNKVGKLVEDAVWEAPNCTKKFSEVEIGGNLRVIEAPVLDGITPRIENRPDVAIRDREHDFEMLSTTAWDVVKEMAPVQKWKEKMVAALKKVNTEVLITYLPVGSAHATRFWAECCIEAGVAYVNAIPEFVCSTQKWSEKFAAAGLPCAGDDIKSQIGATIIHRVLTKLIDERGQLIDDTFQLNVGGNTDFHNMLDEGRLISKRISKTEAVTSQVKDYELKAKIGPSDYISHLKDNKVCYINLRGKQFGDVPFDIDIKLSVEDSPNSAGVMIDAIRLLKVAKDRGLKGYQEFSMYFFKHPMNQGNDKLAKEIVEEFIAKPE